MSRLLWLPLSLLKLSAQGSHKEFFVKLQSICVRFPRRCIIFQMICYIFQFQKQQKSCYWAGTMAKFMKTQWLWPEIFGCHNLRCRRLRQIVAMKQIIWVKSWKLYWHFRPIFIYIDLKYLETTLLYKTFRKLQLLGCGIPFA